MFSATTFRIINKQRYSDLLVSQYPLILESWDEQYSLGDIYTDNLHDSEFPGILSNWLRQEFYYFHHGYHV